MNSADLPSGCRVDRLEIADIPACIRLAQASFAEFAGNPAAVAQWFDARIIHNPWQPRLDGIGVGIRRGDELVAFRAMFAQPWWLQGAETVVVFAAHTAVAPELRGHGLGTQMIAASTHLARVTGSTTAGVITQKAYARLGFAAVGGSDNRFFRCRASYRGSLQSRFGRAAGTLLGMVVDLRLRRHERALGPISGMDLRTVTHCDSAFDALWLRIRRAEASCLERSSRYLNWRLFEQPTAALRLCALHGTNGELRAFAVWTTVRYSDTVGVAVLRDLGVPADDEAAARALLRLLLEHWRGLGLTWVSFEVTSASLDRLYAELGYEHVPSRGNRYHVYSDPPLPAEVMSRWFRSGLDGDYFDLGT